MRVPLSWLGEFVDLEPGTTPEAVHAALVSVGLEEEEIHRFELTGPIVRSFHVIVAGRAGVVDELLRPADATISLPSALFMRLAGGRVDPASVLDQIRIDGDRALGEQVATHLAYTI